MGKLKCAVAAALALLLAQGAVASGLTGSETISTLAGTGAAGSSGDGGPATAATLQARGVAADEAGNVYIADPQNHVVRKIDSSGNISPVAGTGVGAFTGDNGLATQASLRSPMDVAVDGQGNVYIADLGNNRIRKVAAATGIITTFAGSSANTGFTGDSGPATQATLGFPRGLGVTRDGIVYIADTDNQRIRRVNANGIIETVAGDGQIGLGGTAGDGGPATQASLWNPTDVALDAAGNIYVADGARGAVRRINTAGIISNYAGRGTLTAEGSPATQFALTSPSNVAVDSFGNVYVSDAATPVNRVFKIDSATGAINTVAGSGAGPGFGGDAGAANGARLFLNFGIGMDLLGNLYIADMGNNRIRKVSASAQSADLAVTKRCQPASVALNQDFTCTITVTNNGPGGAIGVQVIDTFAPTGGLSVASATPSNGSCSPVLPSVVICNVGGLAPAGAATTVTLVLRSSQPGRFTDTAVVTGPQPDPSQGNNSAVATTVVSGGNADLSVAKEHATASVRVGQEARYLLRVTNHGPDTATNVQLTDLSADLITRVLPQPGWMCSGEGTAQVNCTLDSLPFGDAPTIEIKVPTAAVGETCNSAVSVQAPQTDPVPGNNVASHVCVSVTRSFALSEFVAFSNESTLIGPGSNVHSGSIGTNTRRGTASTSQVETFVTGPLQIAPSSFVLGETVRLDNAPVADVRANDPVLLVNGAFYGSLSPVGSLPVLIMPALLAATPDTAASGDVAVGLNESMSLPLGRYRNVSVRAGGTLTLQGYAPYVARPGESASYHFARINLGRGAKLVFSEPSPPWNAAMFQSGMTVRVQGRIYTDVEAYIGPANPQGQLKAKKILFHVGGVDIPGGRPPANLAVSFGARSEVQANIYAPKGSIVFATDSKGTGAFVGRKVGGIKVDWTLDSAF